MELNKIGPKTNLIFRVLLAIKFFTGLTQGPLSSSAQHSATGPY